MNGNIRQYIGYIVALSAAEIVSIPLLGCRDSIPEGVYLCKEEGHDTDCPSGWYCRTDDAHPYELRCYSTSGSVGSDNSVKDQSADDSGKPDAKSGGDESDAGLSDGAATDSSGGGDSRDSGDGGVSDKGDSGGVQTDSSIVGDSAVEEVCGDGRVTGSEKCDIGIKNGKPGACPSECPEPSGCIHWELVGTLCRAKCELKEPIPCMDSDNCCPQGCTYLDDSDCSTHCGDGIVQREVGETCEPRSALGDGPDADESACPTQCEEDGDLCTEEILTGSEANCNVVCSGVRITSLVDGDKCCPRGANANTDSDCKPICGNAIREGDEECDGVDGCDDQCKSSLTPEQRTCLEVDTIHEDECLQCLCTNCTSQALLCLSSGDADIDEKCAKVVECGYRTGCTGPYCYCGMAVDPLTQNCLLGNLPNGPCKAEIEEAAGTADMVVIFIQRSDPSTAIGRATAFSTCEETNCYDICDPSS